MVTSLEKKAEAGIRAHRVPSNVGILFYQSLVVRVKKKFHPFCNVFGRKTTRFKSRLTCPHAFSDIFLESLKMSKFNVFAVFKIIFFYSARNPLPSNSKGYRQYSNKKYNTHQCNHMVWLDYCIQYGRYLENWYLEAGRDLEASDF